MLAHSGVSGVDNSRIRLVDLLGELSTSLVESEESHVSREACEIDVCVGVALVSDASGTVLLHAAQYQPCHD